MSTKNNYLKLTMPFDPSRELVWKEIVSYLKKYINHNDSVIELGAGYCHFINNIQVDKKTALDLDGRILKKYANSEVYKIAGNVLDFEKLVKEKFNVIFASNLLEHLSMDELHLLLPQLRNRLNTGGLLILMQPNYRYAFREYFDDYDHKSIHDHVSLERLLKVHNFKTTKVYKKFLPYSVDSNLPVYRWLVYLYLRFPLKLFAKQMLIIVKK